ncbi:bifunctional (p)ppGpp synthetase/guanosine-3',5'-bis(diphosphate) 3'-pyrophosphohydrolase [Candidatus Woesearchaeota archaeon]|nr:MAG: bifunctional (p)ppGpp synthetase/guanosine-3',5'-bis(diphosphate) 3'-pyrophosphohydrolase [Candidatus Woesearchaeota archaeon]
MKLWDVLKLVRKQNKDTNIALIRKSYFYAKQVHAEQKRVSGDPFIQHPLNVAYILAELNMDDETIAAALLHDVVEDSEVQIEDIKKEFGEQIANLVDGVTKISKLKAKSKEEYHAESLRKVILASAKDIRVIFIKLADKLHNMRTLHYFREEKRKRISREVMNIYAPIAHKLGIASIKWELEDLAFKYLEPQIYEEIKQKIKMSQSSREKEIKRIKKILEKELAKAGYKDLKIFGRPKHIYSIYRKMQKKNLSFEQIYDLAALRIITKNIKDCYAILGIIHNLWKPIPNEFDDYIAMPKSNMYQSLHTAVIGPEGKPVEIQIRTEHMDQVAEEGIAAHWKYKGLSSDEEIDKKISWLRQIMYWQKESKDYKEFMEMLHIDFFEDEIFTFTPQGDVIRLPKGATIIDFAYAIHSRIGDMCSGAKVNNKFVPLRTILENGDQVEIITSKKQHPARDWLKIVITTKAKSKIKKYLRENQSIPVKTLPKGTGEKKELEQWIIHVDGLVNPVIKLAKCCHPLPGDDIIGYTTATEKVTIHKKLCHNAKKASGSRKKIVNVYWTDNVGSSVEIKVDALNRIGLFAEILNAIVKAQTQVLAANAKSLSNTDVECSFTIESKDLDHLRKLISVIKKLKDVRKVYIGKIN